MSHPGALSAVDMTPFAMDCEWRLRMTYFGVLPSLLVERGLHVRRWAACMPHICMF